MTRLCFSQYISRKIVLSINKVKVNVYSNERKKTGGLAGKQGLKKCFPEVEPEYIPRQGDSTEAEIENSHIFLKCNS